LAGSTGYRVGWTYEYMLVRQLARAGYFVVRAPASGRGHRRFYVPDVIAIKRVGDSVKVLFIEVKYLGDGRSVYVEVDRFNKLNYVASKAGATPFICVFYKDIGEFRCLNAGGYTRRTGSYYVYGREDFEARGKRVGEL